MLSLFQVRCGSSSVTVVATFGLRLPVASTLKAADSAVHVSPSWSTCSPCTLIDPCRRGRRQRTVKSSPFSDINIENLVRSNDVTVGGVNLWSSQQEPTCSDARYSAVRHPGWVGFLCGNLSMHRWSPRNLLHSVRSPFLSSRNAVPSGLVPSMSASGRTPNTRPSCSTGSGILLSKVHVLMDSTFTSGTGSSTVTFPLIRSTLVMASSMRTLLMSGYTGIRSSPCSFAPSAMS